MRSEDWWGNFKLEKSFVLHQFSFYLVLIDKKRPRRTLQVQKSILYGFNAASSTTLRLKENAISNEGALYGMVQCFLDHKNNDIMDLFVLSK